MLEHRDKRRRFAAQAFGSHGTHGAVFYHRLSSCAITWLVSPIRARAPISYWRRNETPINYLGRSARLARKVLWVNRIKLTQKVVSHGYLFALHGHRELEYQRHPRQCRGAGADRSPHDSGDGGYARRGPLGGGSRPRRQKGNHAQAPGARARIAGPAQA